MTELEKVEKLREKANVSFTEAKEALDSSSGDILDALIYLENKGKVTAPAGGGFFSGTDQPVLTGQAAEGGSSNNTESTGSGEEFTDLIKRFGKFCMKLINKGLNNCLVATKGDRQLFSCPVLIVIVLLIIFYNFTLWVTIPVFIITLFCGVRYRFTGEDLGRDSVNSVMDSASVIVEDVKKSFAENANKDEDKE